MLHTSLMIPANLSIQRPTQQCVLFFFHRVESQEKSSRTHHRKNVSYLLQLTSIYAAHSQWPIPPTAWFSWDSNLSGFEGFCTRFPQLRCFDVGLSVRQLCHQRKSLKLPESFLLRPTVNERRRIRSGVKNRLKSTKVMQTLDS